jgi:hypothetical protein
MLTRWALLWIWLASLLVGIVIVLSSFSMIPGLFLNLLDQVLETFAPTIGVIIGFMFSQGKRMVRSKTSLDILAIGLSAVYCLIALALLFLFWSERSDAATTVSLLAHIRPRISFLVTAVIAFYFGAQEKLNSSAS